MPSAPRVFTPGLLIWLAAALFWSTAGASDARAGCGSHAWPKAHAFSADLLVISDLGPAPAPFDAPRPCTGPSCSGRNGPPVAAHPPDRVFSDQVLPDGRAFAIVGPPGRADAAHPGRVYASPVLPLSERPPRP